MNLVVVAAWLVPFHELPWTQEQVLAALDGLPRVFDAEKPAPAGASECESSSNPVSGEKNATA